METVRSAVDSTREDDSSEAVLKRVESLATLLDAQFRLPGTNIRYGLDALLGLIPVVGDTLSVLPQVYLLAEAVRLKVPKRTILRMLWNVFIDWLVGLVPVIGDVFDVGFKSNLRNARLLADAIRKP